MLMWAYRDLCLGYEFNIQNFYQSTLEKLDTSITIKQFLYEYFLS